MTKKEPFITPEVVERNIYLIRNKRVMLDRDIAVLYGVETKVLNQAVKRNMGRFPEDFMFQLTREEVENPRSQIVTLKQGQNIKYLPYAFTEHGILMLSSVLNSHKAIQVNIQIMRIFIKLREMALTHRDLLAKIEQLESKYDEQFLVVFKAIKALLDDRKEPPKRF